MSRLLPLAVTVVASWRPDGHHVQNSLSWLPSEHNDLANASYFNGALLDHSGSIVQNGSKQVWSQRYYYDARFWCGEGCPIFLYIGGEGPQGPPSSKLFFWHLAEQHGALMLSLEHRFYGESRPTADMTVDSLQYLTSEQALGDLAHFREYIASYVPSKSDMLSTPPLVLPASPHASKWVSFGGSYPGNLATWFKAKYPALVAGTVGSSAPVFAEYDFAQYAEVVGAALGSSEIGGSADCVASITAGADALAKALAEADHDAAAMLPAPLRPCSSISAKVDRATYFGSLMGNFQGVVQYNLEGRRPYVSDVCNAVAGAGKEPLDALAAATLLFSENTSEPACVPSSFEKDTVQGLTNTTFNPGCNLRCSSMRQWIWQSCNEFGYFQTASSAKQPFAAWGADLDILTAGKLMCEGAFGISSYDGPRHDAAGLVANTEYGARAVLVPNTTLPNGNMDPWHSLAVVNTTDSFFEAGGGRQVVGRGVTLVELDGTAHCRDMYAPGIFAGLNPPVNDTASVKWAHATIATAVRSYLK